MELANEIVRFITTALLTILTIIVISGSRELTIKEKVVNYALVILVIFVVVMNRRGY